MATSIPECETRIKQLFSFGMPTKNESEEHGTAMASETSRMWRMRIYQMGSVEHGDLPGPHELGDSNTHCCTSLGIYQSRVPI